jgi:hypothetical protein
LRDQLRQLASELTNLFDEAEKGISAHPTPSVVGALLIGVRTFSSVRLECKGKYCYPDRAAEPMPGVLDLSLTRVLTHGVIPDQSHTEALRISSPGIDEAHLVGPAMTGELQWSIMSDWTFL